ncbi:MAG TPA: polyprenyl synthetase family protein [Candidatus Methanofastidiosa archaeon]|nr:polyprenyl synthetase family protein [Candidatus Methanofastidiosa archaeon]
MLDIEDYLEDSKKVIEPLIERALPKVISENYINYLSGRPSYAYDTMALNKGISEPVWDFLSRGGKRWRPALFLLITKALGGDLDRTRPFAAIPELVHNGTIIIDDIEDGADTRRGKPSLHLKFGVDTAINSGNAIYFIPLAIIEANKGRFAEEVLLDLYSVYSKEMINVHMGQAMDIAWHRGERDPSEIDEMQYMQMCAYKTGTLARMSAKLAAVLSGASDEQLDALGRFAESIGIAFQIQDDILDIVTSGEEREKFGKPYGNDITEGKITLIVIKTLHKADARDRKALTRILQSHTKNKRSIDAAIRIIEKYGAIEECEKVARSLVESSWEKAEKVIPDGHSKDVLGAFANFLIERKL